MMVVVEWCKTILHILLFCLKLEDVIEKSIDNETLLPTFCMSCVFRHCREGKISSLLSRAFKIAGWGMDKMKG